jgi:predicted Zn finger-like uncharacterized protein
VPILRATCPECRAAVTSESGFSAGEVVTCPKCGTYFEATAPKAAAAIPAKPANKKSAPDQEEDDMEYDDRPQKKAKRRRDDDEEYDDDDDRPRKGKKKAGGYKTSPVRFVVLGILVATMLVLGVFLVLKMKKERDDAKLDGDGNTEELAELDNRVAVNSGLKLKPLANPGSPAGGGGGGGVVPQPTLVDLTKCIDPKLTGPELETARRLGSALVGKWSVPMAKTDDLYTFEYKMDGTFSESRKKSGKTASGSWQIVKADGSTLTIRRGQLTVTAVLAVQRTGAYKVEHTNTLPFDADVGQGMVSLLKN